MSAACRRDWLALASKGNRLIVLKHGPITNLLVMELINIQTDHLSLLRDTKTHARSVLEDEEEDRGNNEGVRGDGADISKLFADLDTDTIETTWGKGSAIEG